MHICILYFFGREKIGSDIRALSVLYGTWLLPFPGETLRGWFREAGLSAPLKDRLGAGEVDGFWLDLVAYSDASGWGWQERLGRSIWAERASWLSWYHREREFMKVKHVSQDW
jgi:hypothetical protein